MPSKPVPREQKKSLKGWATGQRKTHVLDPMWSLFCDAAQRGTAQCRIALAIICERFHFQIPPETPDLAEIFGPFPQWTPETIYDPFEGLDEEQKETRRGRMDVLNQRIDNYYSYHYSNLSSIPTPATEAATNAINIFLNALSGNTRPPRGRSAVQHYQHVNAEELTPIYKEVWADEVRTGKVEPDAKQTGNWREKIARQHFNELDEDEQERLKEEAKAHNDEAKKEFKRILTEPPSQTPEARQAAIDVLPKLVAPLLKGFALRTGLHMNLLCGGPLPKYNGQINIICVSAGRNLQASAKSWPNYPGFKETVSPNYKAYLATAFSSSDIESASMNKPEASIVRPGNGDAILDTEGLIKMDAVAEEDEEDEAASPPPKTRSKKSKAKPKQKQKEKENEKSGKAKSKAKAKAKGNDDAPVPKKKQKADAVSEKVEPPPKSSLAASLRPAARSGQPLKSDGPAHGKFDVRHPEATWSADDPPRVNEGNRRLLWERERYRLSKFTETAKVHRELVELWDKEHVVDETGIVAHRPLRAPSPASSTAVPDKATAAKKPGRTWGPKSALQRKQAPTTAENSEPDQAGVPMDVDEPERAQTPDLGAGASADTPLTDKRPAKRPRAPSVPSSTTEAPASKRQRRASTTCSDEDAAQAQCKEVEEVEEEDEFTRQERLEAELDPEADEEEDQEMEEEDQEKEADQEKEMDGAESPAKEVDDIPLTSSPKAAKGASSGSASAPPSPGQPQEQGGLARILTCPADAPEWVSANFEVFSSSDVDLGPKHRAALEKWLKLEKKWGYDVNKGTTSKGAATRPDVLDKWIRNGRAPRTKKIPAIADIAAFEKEVWRWWGGMQPEWRNMEADGRPSVDREVELSADWGLLGVHGQNGMLNAVALASWWGVALGGRASRSWQRFLDEVIWVCEEQAN